MLALDVALPLLDRCMRSSESTGQLSLYYLPYTVLLWYYEYKQFSLKCIVYNLRIWTNAFTLLYAFWLTVVKVMWEKIVSSCIFLVCFYLSIVILNFFIKYSYEMTLVLLQLNSWYKKCVQFCEQCYFKDLVNSTRKTAHLLPFDETYFALKTSLQRCRQPINLLYCRSVPMIKLDKWD